MQILIHPADEVPIYRQIMRQITHGIAAGHLKPGDRLPSHRELSEQLVIAPLTVKKAYDELELAGFLESQRGRGTFVSVRPPQADPTEQCDQLRESARRFLADAYLAGFDYEDVLQILQEASRSLAAPAEKETI